MKILMIVFLTILITSVATIICFSCVVANGLEEKQAEAYEKGFRDGQKSRSYMDKYNNDIELWKDMHGYYNEE